jgi:exopolysaccharide production protein ExoQ
MIKFTNKILRNDSAGSPVWLIVCFVVYLLINTTRILNWDPIQDERDYAKFSGTDVPLTLIGNAIFALSLVYLFLKRASLMPIVKSLWPLLVLYAWALASVFWSEIPVTTLIRWIKSFILVSLVINIFQTPAPVITLRKSIYVYSWACAGISIIIITLFRRYGWMEYEGGYLPCGIFFHKNGLGVFAATMLLALFALMKMPGPDRFDRIPFGYKLLIGILLLELIISRAMDVIGALGLSGMVILFILLLQWIPRRRYFIAAAICFLVSSMLVFSIFTDGNILSSIAAIVVRFSGKDMSFTGRTDIWPDLLSLGMHKRPWVGSGYGVFFLALQNSGEIYKLPWIPTHAHNTFLQIFLELGIVGLFLLSGLIIITIVQVIKLWPRSPFSSAIFMGILTLYMVQTIFETAIMASSLVFFMFTYMQCFIGIPLKDDLINGTDGYPQKT